MNLESKHIIMTKMYLNYGIINNKNLIESCVMEAINICKYKKSTGCFTYPVLLSKTNKLYKCLLKQYSKKKLINNFANLSFNNNSKKEIINIIHLFYCCDIISLLNERLKDENSYS